jgi:hypothetical protein
MFKSDDRTLGFFLQLSEGVENPYRPQCSVQDRGAEVRDSVGGMGHVNARKGSFHEIRG